MGQDTISIPAARIALVGDFNREVTAHRAIGECFALFRSVNDAPLESTWLGTETIAPGDDAMLRGFDGIWCVPASPYKSTAGALRAIEFARTRGIPFLGTCGGFQHALLEFARKVRGLAGADHQELSPETSFALIHRLNCSLVEKSQAVIPTGRGRFSALCGPVATDQGYCCSFGLNPAYEHLLQNGPLEIAARSGDGEVRAVELRDHPFFIGTLFQPERAALNGRLHPLVRGFFLAAQERNSCLKSPAHHESSAKY